MQRRGCFLAVLMLCGLSAGQNARAQSESAALICPADASPLVQFAAKEVRRYVYLRTNAWLPIVAESAAKAQVHFLKEPALAEQAFALKTDMAPDGRRTCTLSGGSDVAVLYAAYRFAEVLGVRFYLHGDTIPDAKLPFCIPELAENHAPLFPLRGIQPFHDFPEGPDWWSTDHYKAIVSQLPKLRMNFIGLHTYPQDRPNAEPTTWIGRSEEVNADGSVQTAYPASYYNTALTVNWGYKPKPTSQYACGGAALFDRDDYGSETMRGLAPRPEKPEDCNEIFLRAGTMFKDVFTLAHELGIKTCIGTETPLVVPREVAARMGKDAKAMSSEDMRKFYEGLFTRIQKTHPLDYYWLWTPENWTWENVSKELVESTINDIRIAYDALKATNSSLQMATCGWVLGPQYDRSYLDATLPKDIAVSCINRQTGHEPVEPGFAKVAGRGKWAIPWLEDDPAMSSPQLWVGRMRRDARDALAYGCDGLMGIHWRTRILAPNVAALAQAGWRQTDWPTDLERGSGVGGGTSKGDNAGAILNTVQPQLYRTNREGMSVYRVTLPNGSYRVLLQFCDRVNQEAGKRVFSVRMEGQEVLKDLDIAAEAGRNAALNRAFENIAVGDGMLDIEFVKQKGEPVIAGIEVAGESGGAKIDCGGPGVNGYAPDLKTISPHPYALDFYRDWVVADFGLQDPGLVELFTRIDGQVPRPSDWIGGPGAYKPDARPWKEVQADYDFVDELAAYREKITGMGNLERFDYWLHTFEFLRATAKMKCAWYDFDTAFENAKKEQDPKRKITLLREKVLPLRVQLARTATVVIDAQLSTVTTTGAMGTLCNIEQQTFPRMLEKPGNELEALLGTPLPVEAFPRKEYAGPPRIVVTAERADLEAGEALEVRAVVLDKAPAQEVTVCWRPLGDATAAFQRVPMPLLARQTYATQLQPSQWGGSDFEYYIEATPAGGATLRWPVSAPDLNNTVVIMPEKGKA